MNAHEVARELLKAPHYADVLAKTADGRWLRVEKVVFTYNPADGLASERPSNACVQGPELEPAGQ